MKPTSLLATLARRTLLAAAVAAAAGLVAGCASVGPRADATPPVIFVHGNGDHAALWKTPLWRFESNGWPRDRLLAIDMPNPTARSDDTRPQPGRSSAAEQAQVLAAAVERMLTSTGAAKVVLVANSRGGNTVRNYIQNFGGAAKVSHAVLGGTPNHGVWADPARTPNNEFNGAGPFLQGLNAPKGPNGDEVTPGVRWMTLRSDNNDKYAQPDGRWIGQPGVPSNVTAEGPALKGALNVVLPGRDHREVSYHAEAFVKTYEFITGKPPRTTSIEPETSVVLDGLVGAPGPGGPTNLPLAGATVEVFAVDADTGARRGAALHKQTVGSDGRWGPMATTPTQPLEFVVTAAGQPTLHVYRSPFPRSSSVVNFRPEALSADDRAAKAVVILKRPRGYFGVPRDHVEFDGRVPASGIPPGVAGVDSSRMRLLVAPGRPVTAHFRSGGIDERVVGAAWPVKDNRVTLIELHH